MKKKEIIKKLKTAEIGFLKDAIRKKAFSSYTLSYYKEELKKLESRKPKIKKKSKGR